MIVLVKIVVLVKVVSAVEKIVSKTTISVIHNIINEYKAERGYYTIMPTKKELQQTIDKLKFHLHRIIYDPSGDFADCVGRGEVKLNCIILELRRLIPSDLWNYDTDGIFIQN